jgi:dephospho-CoA kinase
MLKKIEAIFKIDYKNPNFKKQLSEIVFNDKAKLEILNDIVHPYVFKKIKEIVKKYKKEKYLVIDMPLLIEVGYKVDHILLIYASKETQINRVIKRDNLSYNDALKRVESQMDIELKKTYANTIINNEIDLDIELNQFIGGLINEK